MNGGTFRLKILNKKNDSKIMIRIKEFIDKHQKMARFGIVGVWNTIFGYLIYLGLETLFSKYFLMRSLAYISALIIANFISIINAYISHKYITFKSPVRGRAIFLEFIRFSTTYIGNFILSLVLLPIFVEILNISAKFAGGIVILICMMASYWGHSKFSFRKDK